MHLILLNSSLDFTAPLYLLVTKHWHRTVIVSYSMNNKRALPLMFHAIGHIHDSSFQCNLYLRIGSTYYNKDYNTDGNRPNGFDCCNEYKCLWQRMIAFFRHCGELLCRFFWLKCNDRCCHTHRIVFVQHFSR